MAYTTLKAAIQAVIKQNGNNEITGDLLQQALLSMISSLGAENQFGGEAKPTDNPGTPDYKVAYLASTPGTYSNFGGITLADGEVAILLWNGSAWSKQETGLMAKDSAIGTDMLLAEMGDVSDGSKIPLVSFVKDALCKSVNWGAQAIDLANVRVRNYSLRVDGSMTSNTNYKHKEIPVQAGDILVVQADPEADAASVAVFMTDYTRLGPSATIPIAFSLSVGKTYVLKAPAGATRFVWTTVSTYGNVAPTAITLYREKVADDEAGQREITPVSAYGYGPYNEAITAESWQYSFMIRAKAGKTYLIHLSRSSSIVSPVRVASIPELPYANQVPDTYNDYTFSDGVLRYVATADAFLMFAHSSSSELQIVSALEVDSDAGGVPKSCTPSGADVPDLVKDVYYFDTIPVSTLTKRTGFINNVGCYQYSSKHVITPIAAGGYVVVQANANNSAYFAFLSSNAAPVTGEPAALVGGTHRMSVAPGERTIVRVPVGAAYLYVHLGTVADYPNIPAYVGVSAGLAAGASGGAGAAGEQLQTIRTRHLSRASVLGFLPADPETDGSGWDVLPKELQRLNSLKKAMQLCNIKWTPKGNIMGKNDPDGTAHESGVEQTGIPYSGNWHNYKYVGIEVSIETFMTAVNNPYSLLYTENISGDYSRSAWGKKYYNTNGWSYYGTVCCGFTSGVNGQPTKYGNVATPIVARTVGIFIPIFDDRNLDNLKLCDIYDNNAHSFLIFGLHRDANGHVDKVKIAESTSAVQGTQYRTFNSVSAFINHINRSGDFFYGYRCADLYKNVEYTPSPFVPLSEFGENPAPYVYNNDICCFAGDKATFMQGDRIAVNYNLTATPSHTWTGIEVYKDDVLLNTYSLAAIDQSALDESQRYHALDLGTSLAPGKYKARMTDGANFSDYTYWEILNNNISVVQGDGGEYIVKVNSGEPLMYVYCGQEYDGGEYFFGVPSGVNFFLNRAGREPDWDEAFANEMRLYYDKLLSSWGYDPAENSQIRVMLKGDYGMAATPPITLPGR